MPDLKKALRDRLKNAERIAVLGIGSDLRGDDGAGMLAASRVDKIIKTLTGRAKLKVFLGATAPENLTGEIKRFKPSHLIIIDTVDFKEKPGTIIVLEPDRVGEGASFSTHNMPAKILVDYFFKSFDCKAVIIGVQPKSLEFGKPVSKDVREAVKDISDAIAKSIK